MKKSSLIVVCLFLSFISTAQEKVRQKEAGLLFNSFDNFGLTYRFGTQRSLWRMQALFVGGSNTKSTNLSSTTTNNSLGAGIQFGKEFRKSITPKLTLRTGADLTFSYVNTSNSSSGDFIEGSHDRQNTYSPGMNFILGLNYSINDQLVIGAEVLPYFQYNMEHSKVDILGSTANVTSTGFNYGLSSRSVMLSLCYVFH